jgi:pimeloyl-ACP methyl ester carboxylesterase
VPDRLNRAQIEHLDRHFGAAARKSNTISDLINHNYRGPPLISIRKLFLWLLSLALFAYAGMCGWIYFRQQAMLFPADSAPHIDEEWQPTAGGQITQTMLQGSCGKLHAVLWDKAGSKGVVMVFHGNAENLKTVEDQVAEFHGLGYAVASWDYPGYGRSENCWFDERDLLRDADTAFQWARQQAGNRPVTLYGRSIGTGLALYVASHESVQKVLLISPYDSLANVGKDHMPPYVPVKWLILYPLQAQQWIARVQAPVYAIHGLSDTLIAPERARLLMQHARENAQITWVKNAGHRASELFGQSGQWLKERLAD